MKETLAIFESVINSKWFVKSTIFLNFTFLDKFEEKVASGSSPVAKCFSSYDGNATDVAAAREFFTDQFMSVMKEPREVTIHYFDATHTDQVTAVLEDLCDKSERIAARRAESLLASNGIW
jgi:guanine nucleotide-binding protein subunit alpha